MKEILDKLSDVRVLVCGDAILDVYHFGRVDRISPEAPVPIFVEDLKKIETRRGGADNVAHQLEALGCQVSEHLSKFPSVKHRYMVGHHQVFRIDYDSDAFGESYTSSLEGLDCIVLSDYNKGFLTSRVCQGLLAEAWKLEIPVIVDPKGTDWTKYQGADIICPNEKEWAAVQFIEPPNADLVIKYGEKGLGIRRFGETTTRLMPARAKTVFDVTGAGDVVVAVLAAAIGTGASLEDAATLANLAAGHVVGQLGTAVCSSATLARLVNESTVG